MNEGIEMKEEDIKKKWEGVFKKQRSILPRKKYSKKIKK